MKDRHHFSAGLLRAKLDAVRGTVEPPTWEAALRVLAGRQSPADVASALGMTRNAVYVAKARVLRKVRAAFPELLD